MAIGNINIVRSIELPVEARRHKITIENPGPPVADGDGGYTESWVSLGDHWAAIEPVSARVLEQILSGATVTALALFLIVVRYVAGVTTQTRVRWAGRTFAVVGFRNVGEQQVRLELVCEERVTTIPDETRAKGAA